MDTAGGVAIKPVKTTYVDVLKLFFAHCVVAIHTSFLYEISNGIIYDSLYTYLFKFAVPFFFICSGFFLGKKFLTAKSEGQRNELLLKYFKRFAKSYLFWGIIIFLVQIGIECLHRDSFVKEAILKYSHQWLVTSPGGGLWYVQTILVILLIMLMIGTTKKFDVLCIIFL